MLEELEPAAGAHSVARALEVVAVECEVSEVDRLFDGSHVSQAQQIPMFWTDNSLA